MAHPKLTPRKAPRQGRAKATVDAMLTAASRLTAERGVEGWTTNHAAELAGVSIGSLYQYFPSKESLVTALHLARLGEKAEALGDALTSGLSLAPAPLAALVVARLAPVYARCPRVDRELALQAPRVGAARKLRGLEAEGARVCDVFLAAREPRLGAASRARRAFLLARSLDGMFSAMAAEHPESLEEEAGLGDVAAVVEGLLAGALARPASA